MHTPEQAKKLWCPMVHGRAADDPIRCLCLADKCAMWRWGTFIAPPPDAESGKLVAGVNHRASWGYCGIAGRPELA